MKPREKQSHVTVILKNNNDYDIQKGMYAHKEKGIYGGVRTCKHGDIEKNRGE